MSLDDETRDRFDRIEALLHRAVEEQGKLRTEVMARIDRLQDATGRYREDTRMAAEAGQAAYKASLQLLEMTTLLHRRLTTAEQAIDEMREPPGEAA